MLSLTETLDGVGVHIHDALRRKGNQVPVLVARHGLAHRPPGDYRHGDASGLCFGSGESGDEAHPEGGLVLVPGGSSSRSRAPPVGTLPSILWQPDGMLRHIVPPPTRACGIGSTPTTTRLHKRKNSETMQQQADKIMLLHIDS